MLEHISVAYNLEVVKFELISLIYGEIVVRLNFIGLSIDYNQQLPYIGLTTPCKAFGGKMYHTLVLCFINYRECYVFHIQ